MSARAIIKVDMGNDAFNDGAGGGRELARILKYTARKVEMGYPLGNEHLSLMDSNGNKVGTLEIKGG